MIFVFFVCICITEMYRVGGGGGGEGGAHLHKYIGYGSRSFYPFDVCFLKKVYVKN